MDEIKNFLEILENKGEYSGNTLRSYSNDLRRFEEFLITEMNGNLSIRSISVGKFSGFLESEEKAGYKPSTIHRRKVAITQFAEYLANLGVIDYQEIEVISSWKQDIWQEINQRELLFLTESDCEILKNTLLENSSSRVYRDLSVISLLLETGLSINPIIEINLSDLDLRANRVRVDNGFQTIWYTISESVNYLDNYLKSSRPELTQSANEEALFVSQMGGRITRQGVWQIIKGWGEAAGLPVSLSPRVLRHTAVVRMLQSEKSLADIQKLLGHSNIMSTRALVRKLSRNRVI